MLGTCSVPPSLLEQFIASGQIPTLTRNSPATSDHDVDAPRSIDDELAKGYADHPNVDLRTSLSESVSAYFGELLATTELNAILDRYWQSVRCRWT